MIPAEPGYVERMMIEQMAEMLAALTRRVDRLDSQEPQKDGGNADTVDGIHAAATAEANKLLALDADKDLHLDTGDLSGAKLDVTGQITSTLATGTPPLVVASATNVPNLNADTVDGYHGSGGANDVTILDSHNRLDNLMGPGSLGSQWFNRYRLPTTPNSDDREMTADPISGNWAWTTTPGSINASSGVSYTNYPHWMQVYIYGNGAGQADLRCTNAGNLPRWKRLVVGVLPGTSGAGGWIFTMRSVVDANNYIEWLLTAAGGLPPTLQAWYCTGGVRTQNGASITIYPPTYLWLELGNFPGADYLNWGYAHPWGAQVAGPPVITTVANQRAANVNYLQLLFDQGNGAAIMEHYLVDYVRFST